MNPDLRRLFPVTRNYVYLNHSEVCPLSTRVQDAMSGLIEDVASSGALHEYQWIETYAKVRSAAARLVNAHPHEIAFMRNTSDAISAVANGMDWRVGDNVVSCNVEFPANIYPWMRLKSAYGVDMKMAAEREGRIDSDHLLSLIDNRTRLVALSWVQFASGFRADLAKIGKYCRDRGVIFVVDAIQGLGGLRLDVEADCVDAFAADGHKYLLATEGNAILYISDSIIDRLRPTVLGWMSVEGSLFTHGLDYSLNYREGAQRFESGTLNTVGVYGLGAAIDLFLEVGATKIEEYLIGLSNYLAEGLTSRGYQVVSSRRPGEVSAVLACSHENHAPEQLRELLLSRNIVTSCRLGRLRISPHFYNTREDIDFFLSALPGS
jgi:cysteine desulfurase/selenocysteine lyase